MSFHWLSFHLLFRPDIWPSFSSHFYALLTFSAILCNFIASTWTRVFLFMSFQCIHLFIYFIHCIHVIPVIYSLISFILFISFLSFIHLFLSFYSSHSCHLFTYFFHAALLFISYLFVANLLGIFVQFSSFRSETRLSFSYHFIYSFIYCTWEIR